MTEKHTCPSCGAVANCTIEDGYCANGCHETNYCDGCIQSQWGKQSKRLQESDPWDAYHNGY